MSANLKKAFDWCGEYMEDCKDGYAVWAPDVIWNPDYVNTDGSKGAYVMYFCTSSTYIRSVICYAVSKNIEGPYTFVDTLIYTGFTNNDQYVTGGSRTVNKKYTSTNIDELIAKMKAEGRHKQIQSEIKKIQNTKNTDVPKHLAYTEGELFEQYIHDMKIVQEFAVLNRQAMMNEIIKGMGIHVPECFTTIHNYIDTENMILRKGAVSAQKGEKLLIPINMRDGSLICTGKGNPDWNCSAPHGAGRIMSRSQAKQSFTVSEFKKQMQGIYTTSVSAQTLDECPMVYKSVEDIVGNIGDTVEVNEIIKPIYNFKAGEE